MLILLIGFAVLHSGGASLRDWGAEQILNMFTDMDAKDFKLKVEEVDVDCEGAEVEL